jgi:hypothetical protein
MTADDIVSSEQFIEKNRHVPQKKNGEARTLLELDPFWRKGGKRTSLPTHTVGARYFTLFLTLQRERGCLRWVELASFNPAIFVMNATSAPAHSCFHHHEEKTLAIGLPRASLHVHINGDAVLIIYTPSTLTSDEDSCGSDTDGSPGMLRGDPGAPRAVSSGATEKPRDARGSRQALPVFALPVAPRVPLRDPLPQPGDTCSTPVSASSSQPAPMRIYTGPVVIDPTSALRGLSLESALSSVPTSGDRPPPSASPENGSDTTGTGLLSLPIDVGDATVVQASMPPPHLRSESGLRNSLERGLVGGLRINAQPGTCPPQNLAAVEYDASITMTPAEARLASLRLSGMVPRRVDLTSDSASSDDAPGGSSSIRSGLTISLPRTAMTPGPLRPLVAPPPIPPAVRAHDAASSSRGGEEGGSRVRRKTAGAPVHHFSVFGKGRHSIRLHNGDEAGSEEDSNGARPSGRQSLRQEGISGVCGGGNATTYVEAGGGP